jgi:hypothetical protein
MASYIHQNTDMKLYLFLTLDDYAEFEAIQKHYCGRIQWVVNGAEISPFGSILPPSFYGLVEFDGKDANINPAKAFYSTHISFDGMVILADTPDFPEKAKEVFFAGEFPETFDEYLLAVQEEEANPDPIEAELLAAGASLIYSLNLSDTITGDAPGEVFLSESAFISDARGEELMYQFFDPKDTDY